jgi:hypothetical protein
MFLMNFLRALKQYQTVVFSGVILTIELPFRPKVLIERIFGYQPSTERDHLILGRWFQQWQFKKVSRIINVQ